MDPQSVVATRNSETLTLWLSLAISGSGSGGITTRQHLLNALFLPTVFASALMEVLAMARMRGRRAALLACVLALLD